MVIFAVDDEERVLNRLEKVIKEAAPEARIYSFMEEEAALAYAKKETPDVAFLDIRLWNMTGLELARRLKDIAPHVNIIFSTGYEEYAKDAIDLRVSGYLIKPVTSQMVKKELDNLRYPLETGRKEGLTIRAFGNFEVLWNNEPIHFKYTKTHEFLAYLVDRKGSLCTSRQIIDVLWENANNNKMSYYQNVRKDLINTFRQLGCIHVLNVQNGRIGIRIESVQCDYYDYLAGKENRMDSFRGEYMSQYYWSEYTLGRLEMDPRGNRDFASADQYARNE